MEAADKVAGSTTVEVASLPNSPRRVLALDQRALELPCRDPSAKVDRVARSDQPPLRFASLSWAPGETQLQSKRRFRPAEGQGQGRASLRFPVGGVSIPHAHDTISKDAKVEQK